MEIFSSVPITALYAGLNALIALFLAYRVTQFRRKREIAFGDGDDPDLKQAIRAQANNVEYVPMALILLLILEIMGAWALALHLAGAVLTIGRIAHGWGLSTSPGATPGRLLGILATWVVILGLALGCIYMALA